MTFAVGALGIASGSAKPSSSAGLSATISGSGTIPAGSLIIVSVVVNADELSSIGAGDSQSNSYQMAGQLNTGSATPFGYTFYSVTTHPLVRGTDTISVAWSLNTQNVAFVADWLTITGTGVGLDIQIVNSGSSTAPSSGNAAATAHAGELLVGSVAVAGPSGDTYTEASGWTTGTSAGTTGGSATTNVTVHSAYQLNVANGTNTDYKPTLGTSRGWGDTYYTLFETGLPGGGYNANGLVPPGRTSPMAFDYRPRISASAPPTSVIVPTFVRAKTVSPPRFTKRAFTPVPVVTGTYTVTLTASGAHAFNGVGLSVKVVTGAATTQNGATATSASASPGQLAITPNATGSWIYAAISQVSGVSDPPFTPNSSSTFSMNHVDSTDFVVFGAARSISTTTSGTPVTIGASAPSQVTHVSLAEILSAGTLAEDQSSPAPVAADGLLTVTTLGFTPPPGSLLVAMGDGHWDGTAAISLAISNSGPALTWTQLIADADNLANIWIAQIPSGAPTVAPKTTTAKRPLGVLSRVKNAFTRGIRPPSASSAVPITDAVVTVKPVQRPRRAFAVVVAPKVLGNAFTQVKPVRVPVRPRRAFAPAPLTIGFTPATLTTWTPRLRAVVPATPTRRFQKAFATVIVPVVAVAIPVVPHQVRANPVRPVPVHAFGFRSAPVVKPATPKLVGSARNVQRPGRGVFIGPRLPLPSPEPWTVTFVHLKPAIAKTGPGRFFGPRAPLPSPLPWTTTFIRPKPQVVKIRPAVFRQPIIIKPVQQPIVGSRRSVQRPGRGVFFRGFVVSIAAPPVIRVQQTAATSSPPRKAGRGKFAQAPLTPGFTPATLATWPPRLKANVPARTNPRAGKFGFVFVPAQVAAVPIVPKPVGTHAAAGTIRRAAPFRSSIRVPTSTPNFFGAKRIASKPQAGRFLQVVKPLVVAPKFLGLKPAVAKPQPGRFFRGITVQVAVPIRVAFTSVIQRLAKPKPPIAFRRSITPGTVPPTVTTTPVKIRALDSPRTHAKSQGKFFPVIIGSPKANLGGAPFISVMAQQPWQAGLQSTQWRATLVEVQDYEE